MNRKSIAKRSGLAAALNRGRSDDAPTDEPTKATGAAPALKPEKPKRFHTTVYPEPAAYAEIRIALIREGQGRDFNQLVNELLAEWLEANGDK